MSAVSEMVEKTVKKINAQNLENVESRVQGLVRSILNRETEISQLQEEIVADKKALSDLQLPKPVSLEI